MTRTLIAALLAFAGLGLSPAGGSRQSLSLETLARGSLARIDGTLRTSGLKADVQVIRDSWGVPHIYAQSTDDLFFAQGYVMAQDRLWQMEMWRRAADGRLAEILGAAAIARDRQTRLTKYRGPIDDTELTSYHPEGRRIMSAFVRGVNAFIESSGDALPVEFRLTGIRPEPWTVEHLVLRAPTMGDAAAELQLARSVAELGAAEANRRRNPDPFDPLDVPRGLDVSIIGDDVVAATRTGGANPKPAILPEYEAIVRSSGRGSAGLQAGLAIELVKKSSRGFRLPPSRVALRRTAVALAEAGQAEESAGDQPSAWIGLSTAVNEPGSNNWVLSRALSATGKPVVANDPHREVTLPSLRYIVHLNAPGWNVIGAGEPPFLGVALGHNDAIAWGLTIVGTDQQDVYVEEVNPENPDEVKWNGAWEALRTIHEQIPVKGQAPVAFDMKVSRHGPIFFVDAAHHRAYALRSALLEPGTAPYLAGLRLSQVRNCREFLDAAMYWKAPTENLICGDVDGNISWQASALTPMRKGWVGRLPVPGTGAFEWQGFRRDLPRELNPARGFIATANNNIQPKDYAPPIMFKVADTRFDRITRLLQMIQPGRKYSLEDHQRMQHDAYSLRAAADLPMFNGWTAADVDVEAARADLAAWDAMYGRDSRAAAIYEAWRGAASGPGGRGRGQTAPQPLSRDEVEARLQSAIDTLTRMQGRDRSQWRWGRMHTRTFPHPFVPGFDLPTIERAGGAGSVAADGATYREIMDIADWDRSVGANVPGQSGQPFSPYYSNLLSGWAEKKYFPLVFSKKAVDANATHRLTLRPSRIQASPEGLRRTIADADRHEISVMQPLRAAPIEPDGWRAVEQLYHQQLQSAGIVGSSLVLVRDGAIVATAVDGYQDLDATRRVDADTIYHWASITKTFTGIAIMQLRDRGRLSLDDPIVKYVPEFRRVHNPYGDIAQVTIRHMMTHSSGLRAPTWPWGGDQPWHPFEPTEWDQLVAMLPYTQLNFAPGTRYSYSNPGIIFLGRIIELLSGDDFEVYVTKNILMPLGMHAAFFDRAPYYLLPHRSHSYLRTDGRLTEARFDFDTGITVSNGGLNAPLGDMAKYLAFLIGANSSSSGPGPGAGRTAYDVILKRSSLEEMWKPQIRASDGEGASGDAAQSGLSFFLERHAGLDFVAHSGDQNGFISHFYLHVPSRTAYIVSFNTDVSASKSEPTRPTTRQVDAALRDAIIREIFRRPVGRGL